MQSEQEVNGQNETGQNESEQSKNGTDEESDTVPEDGSTDENQDSADNTESTLTPAPLLDLELTDQFGNIHTLADYKGKVIFLNFWATWCGPCRNEMPDIQKLYEEYSAQGEDAEVVILGVAGPGIGQEGSRMRLLHLWKRTDILTRSSWMRAGRCSANTEFRRSRLHL